MSIDQQIIDYTNNISGTGPNLSPNLPADIKPTLDTFENSEDISQSSSDDTQEYSDSENQNVEFNPVQLVQIFKPIIKPNRIELDAQLSTMAQKREFLTGMGTAPLVYYNGIHIEYSDISGFELYHEGILPALKISFVDRNGIFKDSGFPTDDTTISIFIYSKSKRLRSINMDFKISSFKDFGSNEFLIIGLVNIPQIYLRKFKSYSKKTSFETLQEVAKECELGFCSNVSNSSDKMTWINAGFTNYQFVNDIIRNSYLNDESFINCYIDFYYNICYVDVEKELGRDNQNDQMIISDGKNEFTSDPKSDEDIAPLLLSTDKSVKDTNAYISDYIVTNKSTQVSLNKAYLTKTKFYNSSSKELLIFDVDSITSEGDKTIILKGKPGDEDFFKQNINNIWIGKLDKFEEDGSGNSHLNFNYSLIQNQINIDEISKISIDITLPYPNFNLYIFQKVYLALINQKPGLFHTSLRYKRLTGNWMTTAISFIFDGKKHYQKVTLIKRELELDEDERQNLGGRKSFTNEYNNNPLSPDDYLNNPVNNNLPTTNSDSDNDPLIPDKNGYYITLDQLSKISGIKKSKLSPFIDVLNDTLKKYQINTKLRVINFISQVLHESGGLQYFTEFAPGSAYEGRKDLGNTNPGDGVKFKGRGAIQVTGRYNYIKLSKDLGYDFVNDPKKLAELPWAILSAGWFWDLKKLNKYADKDDLNTITKRINGGTRGIDERRKYQLMAKAEFRNIVPGNNNSLLS
jgi:putative chitinase